MRNPSRFGWRTSGWDSLLVLASLLHGLAFLALLLWPHTPLQALPAALLIAFGICWASQTVSHNHLHNPFFRSRLLNHAFSLYLSALLAIPQSLWKERHLWHHAGEPPNARPKAFTRHRLLEIATLLGLWGSLGYLHPFGLLAIGLPGWLLGLAFCYLQGHYEHADEVEKTGGVSHYGVFYNLFWFNDGYHIEHHKAPRCHWRLLPSLRPSPLEPQSPWPPLLRWLPRLATNPPHPPASSGKIGHPPPALPHRGGRRQRLQASFLYALERLCLRFQWMQRWMIRCHREAIDGLLSQEDGEKDEKASIQTVVIVGGGLFPRTLLALLPLLPGRRFLLLDHDEAALHEAKAYLRAHGIGFSEINEADLSSPAEPRPTTQTADAPPASSSFEASETDGVRQTTHEHQTPSIGFVCRSWSAETTPRCDLLVLPLALIGHKPPHDPDFPASLILAHEWIFRASSPRTRVIAWWLLKRLTLLKYR